MPQLEPLKLYPLCEYAPKMGSFEQMIYDKLHIEQQKASQVEKIIRNN